MSERLRTGARRAAQRTAQGARRLAGRASVSDRAQRPAPVTAIEIGPAVPALVLRAGCAALVLAMSALLAVSPAQLWLGVLLGVGMLLRPSALLTGIAIAAMAAMLLLHPVGGWRIFPLVALSHAMWQLGAVCVVVDWRARVSITVLQGEVRPLLAVQAVAQLIAVAGTLLAGAFVAPWLGVSAVLALAVLAGVLARDAD